MKDKRSNAVRSDGEVVAEVKRKRERSERSKQWQLTENNPTYTKRQAVERLTAVGTAIYGVGCSEVGESGTSHIHAFVIWKNAIELSTLKSLFPRAHFEHCKGSVQSNVAYITKDDAEPYEVGEKPVVVSEAKADIPAEVVALILNGKGVYEILVEYPQFTDYVVRNFRSLTEIASNRPRRR